MHNGLRRLTDSQPNLGHTIITDKSRMWADAQCDGRPAECKWRPLLNAGNTERKSRHLRTIAQLRWAVSSQ